MACVSFCGMIWLLFVLLVLMELLTNIVWRNWKFEDAKGVIRDRKSKTDRHYNVQRKEDKGTNTDLQNTTQKIKDRETRTPLKAVVTSVLFPSIINT